MSTTIRVSDETHQRVAALATSMDRPYGEVIERAVRSLEREEFWRTANLRWSELRADPETWAEVLRERGLTERTARDDL